MGLGPCGLERKAGRGLGLGACLRPRRLDRTRRRGAGVNASAARALVPLFEAENCGRRLEQSSDERAKGRRGEGLGGARDRGNRLDPRPWHRSRQVLGGGGSLLRQVQRERDVREREQGGGPKEKARWSQPGDGAACGRLEGRAEETAGSCWCCSGEGHRVAMELRRELLLEEGDGEAAASGSEEVRRESRL